MVTGFGDRSLLSSLGGAAAGRWPLTTEGWAKVVGGLVDPAGLA